jgi:hypothetical protein
MEKRSPFTETMAAQWREVQDLESGVQAMCERLGKVHRMFWENVRRSLPNVPLQSILTVNTETREIVWHETKDDPT